MSLVLLNSMENTLFTLTVKYGQYTTIEAVLQFNATGLFIKMSHTDTHFHTAWRGTT